MSGHTWRRALVTGGAGFVGSHLCEQLVQEGTEVVCLDNLVTGSRSNVAHLEHRPGFRFVHGDVTDPAAVRGPWGRFDLVLHFACPASPADCLRLPLETLDAGSAGTRNALERAHVDGARFLLASACEVYGDPLEHLRSEAYGGNVDPLGPRSVHDESKRFAEALVTAHRQVHATDAGIVRMFDTYGPRMRAGDGRTVPAFIAQALEGRPLTVAGDGSQTRSLCYVEDTVDGVLALTASHERGPVDIGGTEEITMLELARRVVSLTGSSSPVEFAEGPVDDPGRCRPDVGPARERLGWQPRVSWSEGLARTVDWFARARTAAVA